MRAFVIRFNDPERGTVHAEVVAETEADAREDFEHRRPGCEVIASYQKPVKYGPTTKKRGGI